MTRGHGPIPACVLSAVLRWFSSIATVAYGWPVLLSQDFVTRQGRNSTQAETAEIYFGYYRGKIQIKSAQNQALKVEHTLNLECLNSSVTWVNAYSVCADPSRCEPQVCLYWEELAPEPGVSSTAPQPASGSSPLSQ